MALFPAFWNKLCCIFFFAPGHTIMQTTLSTAFSHTGCVPGPMVFLYVTQFWYHPATTFMLAISLFRSPSYKTACTPLCSGQYGEDADY